MKLRNLLYILKVLAFSIIIVQCTSPDIKTFLIQNATIIDGTGADKYIGSIRIQGNLISEIGNLKVSKSDSVINGTGFIVSPGFIDTHSHHDWDTSKTVDAAISQGITTIIVGQDGSSYPSIKEYFDSLSKYPLSVNIGSYVGHNTVRDAVMGKDFQRETTPDEIVRMKEMIAREMQSGALGLSTGLEYDPGIYSNTNEVIETAKIASQYGGNYISHMRSEDIYLERSIQEIIRIGKEANIPVQISHFKLARKSLWGGAEKILETLDSARNAGIEITADVYPYEYWQATMTVLFPKRDFENRATAKFALTELTSPEDMIISRFDAKPDYEGFTLDKIADLRNEDPVCTYLALIKMSQETPGESIIAKSMDLGDIKTLIRWPHTNLCSDGSPTGHPRGWGAFPRYINMDTGESLETKIHKMTALAAEHLSLNGIGIIKKGYYADLVLFDPNSIVDKATFERSSLRSEGIHLVMVSGEVVYCDQAPTKVYSGRVLKRVIAQK